MGVFLTPASVPVRTKISKNATSESIKKSNEEQLWPLSGGLEMFRFYFEPVGRYRWYVPGLVSLQNIRHEARKITTLGQNGNTTVV